mgnify:CR=1 FL=1
MTTAAFEPVDIITMQLAIDEAQAALAHDDVPVGAAGMRGRRTRAGRPNDRERTGDPTADAELLTAL